MIKAAEFGIGVKMYKSDFTCQHGFQKSKFGMKAHIIVFVSVVALKVDLHPDTHTESQSLIFA